MALRDIERLIHAIESDPNHDIEEIQVLITDARPDEVRPSKRFITLCHAVTQALVKTNRSVCGINLLSNAIDKLQTSRSQLTPIHSDLCLLCLDSKCLNPALKFLDTDYTEIKTTDSKEDDVKHVLLYYYFGGLIFAAVKNFEKASYFFEVVLTFPAFVMNPIMQETYKKQVIIALILNGKLPDNLLPRYTSPCVIRQKRQVGNSYLKLAHEYTSLNFDKIRRLISSSSSNYERDDNMGLVKQCLTLVHKRSIQRLTKTFLTLPLRDVANHVGLASEKEAELFILNMIDEGEIFATINQKDGMVVFQDNPEKYDSAEVFKKLQEDMSACTKLIDTLRKLEVETPNQEVSKFHKMINDMP